jgi:hypothetical protein
MFNNFRNLNFKVTIKHKNQQKLGKTYFELLAILI